MIVCPVTRTPNFFNPEYGLINTSLWEVKDSILQLTDHLLSTYANHFSKYLLTIAKIQQDFLSKWSSSSSGLILLDYSFYYVVIPPYIESWYKTLKYGIHLPISTNEVLPVRTNFLSSNKNVWSNCSPSEPLKWKYLSLQCGMLKNGQTYFKNLHLAADLITQKYYQSLLGTWELSFGLFSLMRVQRPCVNLASIESGFNPLMHMSHTGTL